MKNEVSRWWSARRLKKDTIFEERTKIFVKMKKLRIFRCHVANSKALFLVNTMAAERWEMTIYAHWYRILTRCYNQNIFKLGRSV